MWTRTDLLNPGGQVLKMEMALRWTGEQTNYLKPRTRRAVADGIAPYVASQANKASRCWARCAEYPTMQASQSPLRDPVRALRSRVLRWQRGAHWGPAAALLLVMAGATAAQEAPSQNGSPLGEAKSALVPRPEELPVKLQSRASSVQDVYMSRWGVDDLKVRSTEAGDLLRFSYRVVNADLAKLLNDRRSTPAMVCQRARVVLQMPAGEKGALQWPTVLPEAGKAYELEFSNRGQFVKPGDRVDILIGSFHADALVVE